MADSEAIKLIIASHFKQLRGSIVELIVSKFLSIATVAGTFESNEGEKVTLYNIDKLQDFLQKYS